MYSIYPYLILDITLLTLETPSTRLSMSMESFELMYSMASIASLVAKELDAILMELEKAPAKNPISLKVLKEHKAAVIHKMQYMAKVMRVEAMTAKYGITIGGDF